MKRLARLTLTTFTVSVLFNLAAAAASPDMTLPPDDSRLRTSTLPGCAIAEQKCGICHSIDYIRYQPPGMNQMQWTAEMAKMQHTYGAPINDAEIKQIGAYLAVAYGSAKQDDSAVLAVSAAAPVAATVAAASAPGRNIDVQALLAHNVCLSCHGLKQRIVGPSYHEIAEKYKADPEGQHRLEASIHAGSIGKWGNVPMPPFSALTPDELKALAAFVMQQ